MSEAKILGLGEVKMSGLGVILPILLVLLLGCAPNQTGIGVNVVSEEQAQQEGLAAWKELKAKTPEVTNQAEKQRAQNVASRVLAAAGENPAQWEVVVFDSNEINAFAIPGKKIGIYDGMMKFADTDAQLAAVLGHEIAHNQRGHAAERMSTAVVSQTGAEVAGAALGAAGIGSPDLLAQALGVGVQYGILNPYSRNQELEADRDGLMTMAKAGYDPHQAVVLWQKMESRGDQPPAFLSTHPDPEQRVAQLENLMPQAVAEYRERR